MTKLILLFTILLTLGAARAQAVIGPEYFPVGITFGQTARLTFANIGEIRGFIVNWRFIDADGVIVARSEQPLTIPFGKMVSVDLNRDTLPRTDPRVQIRAQIEVLSPGNPRQTLRQSLEVFDNASRKTTVFLNPPPDND
jgi:hypothetical protein